MVWWACGGSSERGRGDRGRELGWRDDGQGRDGMKEYGILDNREEYR